LAFVSLADFQIQYVRSANSRVLGQEARRGSITNRSLFGSLRGFLECARALIRVEAEANMSGFANNAERLYSNFMAAIAETA
jgi:hypothetical protein